MGPREEKRPGRRADPADRASAKPGRNASPGLASRQAAVSAIHSVLTHGRSLEDAFDHALAVRDGPLSPRDRAFARLVVLTVLRRKGELEKVIGSFLDKPLRHACGRLHAILLAGAAQLLVLGTPPHAAIGLAVDQARADRGARRFDRLVNAVLRRTARDGAGLLATLDRARLDIPDWLYARWRRAYGDAEALRIAGASLAEAPLDLTVKSDAPGWAERLGATLLPTGSLRLAAPGRIEDLAGYSEGAWWVQDAAAALPARLLRDVGGLAVADLCAAPGGKTAQLAAAGAQVTAVDLSRERLARLEANLARLGLSAETVSADATSWTPGRLFDAVLLDAPCTATGTIRRHPDILHLKRESDVAPLADLQARLLANSARLVKPGGLLVYCTCSLEPEEGPEQIARFLVSDGRFARVPVAAGEIGGVPAWFTADGDLRTLPYHMDAHPAGMDGFFATRLRRAASP